MPLVSVQTIRVSVLSVSWCGQAQRDNHDLVVFDIHRPSLSSSRVACDLVGPLTRHISWVPPVRISDKHMYQMESKQNKRPPLILPSHDCVEGLLRPYIDDLPSAKPGTSVEPVIVS